MSIESPFIFIIITFLMPFVFLFASIYLVALLYKLATGEFKKVLTRTEMNKAPWTFVVPMLLFWVVAPILWRIYIDGKTPAEIGLLMGTKPLLYFSISVILGLILGYIAAHMGEKTIPKESVLFLVSAFILVGITEESIVRLFIAGRLFEFWGFLPATLISSIYFVILHLQHPEVSGVNSRLMIQYLILVFGVGIYLALLYFYSKSIWPPFISHLIINCVSNLYYKFLNPITK